MLFPVHQEEKQVKFIKNNIEVKAVDLLVDINIYK